MMMIKGQMEAVLIDMLTETAHLAESTYAIYNWYRILLG